MVRPRHLWLRRSLIAAAVLLAAATVAAMLLPAPVSHDPAQTPRYRFDRCSGGRSGSDFHSGTEQLAAALQQYRGAK